MEPLHAYYNLSMGWQLFVPAMFAFLFTVTLVKRAAIISLFGLRQGLISIVGSALMATYFSATAYYTFKSEKARIEIWENGISCGASGFQPWAYFSNIELKNGVISGRSRWGAARYTEDLTLTLNSSYTRQADMDPLAQTQGQMKCPVSGLNALPGSILDAAREAWTKGRHKPPGESPQPG